MTEVPVGIVSFLVAAALCICEIRVNVIGKEVLKIFLF